MLPNRFTKRGQALAVTAALGLTLALVLASAAHATSPGHNGRIAFERDYPGALYSVGPQGGAVGLLLRGRNLLSEPMYSPDGTKVTFSRARSLKSPVEVAVANADGSGLRVVTRQRGFSFGPAWSPDGNRIVYATDEGRDQPARIHIINADGSGDQRLISSARGDAVDPVFSPDGATISFMVSRPLGGERTENRLWLANADGSGARAITPAGGPNEQNASWSPDGRTIALELVPRRGRSDIAIMNADGSGLRKIAVTRYWETNPVWSPDGTQLAFTSDRDTRPRRGRRLNSGFELYTVHADGTAVTRLTRNRVAELFPDWQTLP